MSETSVGTLTPRKCGWCGFWHTPGSVTACPNVKRAEFYPDGTVKSVEMLRWEPPSVRQEKAT
jgi:hypothetical protein